MSRPSEVPRLALAVLVAAAALLPARPGLAHAALVEAGLAQAIAVRAVFDTGEAMAGAQIVVFAPDDPAQPWLRGQADEEGRFVFVPEPIPGRWAIQARAAGHGAIAHVTLGEKVAPAAIPTTRPAATDPLQRAVMALCVIWGCLGTALYFRRRPA